MLITCETCKGKGKDNDLPPKRCFSCNGKGQVMVTDMIVQAIPDEEKFKEVLGATYSTEEVERAKNHVYGELIEAETEHYIERFYGKSWLIRLKEWYENLFK